MLLLIDFLLLDLFFHKTKVLQTLSSQHFDGSEEMALAPNTPKNLKDPPGLGASMSGLGFRIFSASALVPEYITGSIKDSS